MTQRPLDMDPIARDDRLLDALGSGVLPDSTDPVIDALHLWRADLSADIEPAPVGVVDALRRTRTRRARRGRRRAAVAAGLVVLSAGLSGVAAAAEAEPGSPLWPLTRILYSETATEQEAEAALARARKALAEGRITDAERYLEEADRQAASVPPDSAGELRAEVEAMRARLREQQSTGTPTPSQLRTPDSGGTGSADDPGSVPTPSPTPPTPSPTEGWETGEPTERGNNGRDLPEPRPDRAKGRNATTTA